MAKNKLSTRRSDMLWNKLIFFFFVCVCVPSFNNSFSWLGETPFLTSDKSCDKAIKWILCGWLGLTGLENGRPTKPPEEKPAVSPSHAQESIYLMAVSQSFSQAGINLMDSITYILIWFSTFGINYQYVPLTYLL